jgi:hypothetical protein
MSREEKPAVVDLAAQRRRREKERYTDLVLKAYDDLDHADKREILDRKGEVQIKARETL